MIDYQVGPTYKSTRDDICPISFGIGPLILFHMKSLHEKTQHFSTTWCDKKKDIEGLKLTISRDELIFGDLVIKSRRDSYSSAGCLITKKKKEDQGKESVIGIAGHVHRERKGTTEAASPKVKPVNYNIYTSRPT